MDCVFWNCRGANKPNFRRSLRYMMKKNNIDFLALFETHASGDRANRICQRLGFENSYRVDANGQSGGIWVLWRSVIGEVEVIEAADQFVHVKVKKDMESWNLVVVYAAPSVSRRSGLWERLKESVERMEGPLIMGGDFNTIVRIDERSGGNGQLSQDSVVFGDWIQDLALIDMGFIGSCFTWRRGRVEQNAISKRLDRVLCCPQARLKWHEATVTHLPMLASDHTPLYLQLCPATKGNPVRRPFRFEAAWLQHSEFKDLVSLSWNRDISTPEALSRLKVTLKKWNREIFGDVNKKKTELLTELQRVQLDLDTQLSDDLLQKEMELQAELDRVLEQEEMLWFQKSREKWIIAGDRNTKFFHITTISRRRRNKVEKLKNLEGTWVSEAQELEQLAVAYYKRLYSLADVDDVVEPLSSVGFEALTNAELVVLNNPFTQEEVECAIRSMGKYKSPGPDGYQPVFYQHCWDVVGDSVNKFVLDFFRSGTLPPGTNDALVVLIGKVQNPETIMQFRPISLCNVLFKTITKVMVQRLKGLIGKLIGPAQSSFIPGRLSADNIIIVQEAVHSMRRKKGRKGWMMLKLDLEKAYDRIRWEFLEDTLKAAGFPDSWVQWIMTCVTNPSMSLVWNGEQTPSFKPARGLRQGDPLSPYLFVLCMERLCHLIDMSTASKEWRPISLSRGGPKISHMCFADDLILFAEASVEQVNVIRRVLEKFCLASGQKVSLEKSKIFFSDNVRRELSKLISDASGIQQTRELGKYLGMPVLHKRITKNTFGEVLARVSARLAGWRSRFLSLAGRITLTKSVLSSLPVHTMSTISLPRSTLSRLDQLSRSFLWGSTQEKRKIHLLSWERVTAPKSEGGLGIRTAKEMNMALLAKLGWRLLKKDGSLCNKILLHKYKVGSPSDSSWLIPKATWSSTWRSMCLGMREVVIPGIRWVVHDGQTTRFWQDKWLTPQPLCEMAVDIIPEHLQQVTVRDMWSPETGWDVSNIAPYVSEEAYLILSSRLVDAFNTRPDSISWSACSDGRFSVKSAYVALKWNHTPRQDMTSFFEKIWRALTTERIRVFLWLVSHQVLMTNEERARRHLSSTNICPVCKGGVESTLHVLRDCPAMSGIWARLVPPNRLQAFMAMTLLEWLYTNLGDKKLVSDCPWETLFSVALWWGWKWRCQKVFDTNMQCRDRIKFIRDLAMEIWQLQVNADGTRAAATRTERLISWKRPVEGWFKLNTDGASRGNPGLAAAGGVLRDDLGNWRGGFAFNIGICSAPMAELWGVFYGLNMAWTQGVSQLEVEVDSELVVGFLQKGVPESHPLSLLVQLCYGFFSKDWIVRISHVYREANRLADGLANYAFSLPLGIHQVLIAPEDLDHIRLEDARGHAISRLVCS